MQTKGWDMNEMVERIAVALLANDDEVGAFSARILAKVAIEAMREPTDAMIAAVMNAHDQHRTVAEEWQTMIDTALKE